MNIYFAGSIRGGRSDQPLYFEIIKKLTKYGKVFTEHVADEKLTILGEQDIDPVVAHDRDMQWLNDSHVIVAEVTVPSLGVGYEIAKADDLGKKTLCLYRPTEGKALSVMLLGNKNLIIKYYQVPEELDSIFSEFFRN